MAKNKRKWPMYMTLGFGGLMAVSAVSGDSTASGATSGAKTQTKTQTSVSLSKHMKDIRFCESTDRYTVVSKTPVRTKAGIEYAEGAFQFLPSTWAEWKTGYAHPADAPASVQDEVAVKHQAKYGDSPWLASKPCWRNR